MRYSALFFIALYLLVPNCLIGQQPRWKQTNGPYGGSVFSLHSTGSSIIASTAVGVYSSEDTGASWKLISDVNHLGHTGMVGHDSIVFAEYSDQEIERSLDFGKSWQRTPTPEAMDEIPLCVLGNTAIVSTRHALYRSTNLGSNWSPIGPGEWINQIVAYGSLLLARTNGAVFSSPDTGRTWTQWTQGLLHDTVISLTVSNDTVLLTNADSLYYSVDRGATWRGVQMNLSHYYSSLLSDITLFNGVLIAPFPLANCTFKSFDFGRNWIRSDTLVQILPIGKSLLIAANGHTYRSYDYCKTLLPSDSGMCATNISTISTIGTQLFATDDYSCIYRSSDRGDTWVRVDNGKIKRKIAPLVGIGKWIIAGAEHLWRSSDMGQSWSTDTTMYMYLQFTQAVVKDSLLLVINQNPGNGVRYYFTSRDSGNTLTLEDQSLDRFVIHGDRIYAVLNGSLAEWDGRRAEPNGDLLWTQVGSPFISYPSSALAVGFIGETVLCVDDAGNIFRSTNYGASWVQPTIKALYILPTSQVTIVNHGSKTYVCEDGLIESSNAGQSWSESDTSGMNKSWPSSLAVSNDWLFAGTDRGVYRANELVSAVNPEVASRSSQLSLSPNPASNEIAIHAGAATDLSSITITDVLGRVVLTSTLPKFSLHDAFFHINISNLERGAYHVSVLCNDHVSNSLSFVKE